MFSFGFLLSSKIHYNKLLCAPTIYVSVALNSVEKVKFHNKAQSGQTHMWRRSGRKSIKSFIISCKLLIWWEKMHVSRWKRWVSKIWMRKSSKTLKSTVSFSWQSLFISVVSWAGWMSTLVVCALGINDVMQSFFQVFFFPHHKWNVMWWLMLWTL